jgi:glycosyltransferase involved in cell wall biosynthesis
VNSPGFIDHVKSRGADLVTLIPNGADPEMFDPDSKGSSFRERHHLDDKFIALYAGAHGMSNDLEVVLKAAEHLKNNDTIQIVLLGSGKEKPQLQILAKEKGLSNVLFLPPVPKLKMREALAAADACLAILKPIEMYKTTYPNKVFDYMAAGRAVILAIDGVIREVVETANAGVFVPPGDPKALSEAIQDLALNPSTCERLGKNGRKTIEEKFSREELANQFTALLEQLWRSYG